MLHARPCTPHRTLRCVTLYSHSLDAVGLPAPILWSYKSKSHCDWRSVNQSVLLSSLIWGSWPDIHYCWTVIDLLLWGALSGEKTSQSQSQSHISTDDQSVSKSWYGAPSWGPWPDIYIYFFFLIWKFLSCSIKAPSLTRGRVCHLSVIVRISKSRED
jgi:hypothetical protein